MKKFLNLLFAGLAVIVLSACGGGGGDDDYADSPVKSFNISDLDETGYGVEFEDTEGAAYYAFGCGMYVTYEDGQKVDEGVYNLDGNILEIESTENPGDDASLQTTSGEIRAGQIYSVTQNGETFSVQVTYIQDDTQTCF